MDEMVSVSISPAITTCKLLSHSSKKSECPQQMLLMGREGARYCGAHTGCGIALISGSLTVA